MLVDAMGVFLPDDPDGNAKLVFSILDCLPKANRVSIIVMKIIMQRIYINFVITFVGPFDGYGSSEAISGWAERTFCFKY